ncbi:hypothetical protein EVG20_g3532 [Dentipellis fragilis]|uniref:Uncharacterized protein n=1 Tax=Dentipellis fragilis TaxID=205917 RepID=A0A4Y9Z1U0_9AGAM|nr:hypothetical protein EVG20_g3532 [Dentipellis fragilis]
MVASASESRASLSLYEPAMDFLDDNSKFEDRAILIASKFILGISNLQRRTLSSLKREVKILLSVSHRPCHLEACTMSETPTKSEVAAVAKRIVKILVGKGLSCYLVGGVASMLWGTSRTPNDVDIVIPTTDYNAEEIKRLVARADPRFHLIPSKNPRNTYKVTWFEKARSTDASLLRCKVDFLVPPTLNVPSLAEAHIVRKAGLPVSPLLPLLLLKRQAWEDHRWARYTDLRAKQHTDVADITELLEIAVREGVRVADAPWLSSLFLSAARRRVQSYVVQYYASRRAWRELGFTVV